MCHHKNVYSGIKIHVINLHRFIKECKHLLHGNSSLSHRYMCTLKELNEVCMAVILSCCVQRCHCSALCKHSLRWQETPYFRRNSNSFYRRARQSCMSLRGFLTQYRLHASLLPLIHAMINFVACLLTHREPREWCDSKNTIHTMENLIESKVEELNSTMV